MPLYFGNQTVSKELFRQQLVDSPPAVISIDVETISLKERWPLTIAIATSPDESWSFDCYPEPEREIELIAPLLKNPSIKKVFHNASFDLRTLPLVPWLENSDRSNIADTAVMSRLLGNTANALYMLAPQVGRTAEPADETIARFHGKNMLDVPAIERAKKCANDARVTLALYHKFLPDIDPAYFEVEMKVIPILIDMGLRGILIDQEERAKLETKVRAEVEYYRQLCETEGFNPASNQQVGYILAKRGCLHPDTKVLKADFTWVPVGNLIPGDCVVGVDEYSPRHTRRKLRRSHVTKTQKIKLPSYCIVLSDGRTIIASACHQWLAKEPSQQGRVEWVRTNQLKSGFHIRQLCYPKETLGDYDMGYLSASLDSEGSVSTYSGIRVSYSQNKGRTLDKVRALLDKLNIDTNFVDSKSDNVRTIRTAGTAASIELLSSARPQRLIDNLNWEGISLPRASEPGASNYKDAEVTDIVLLGDVEVIGLETTTGTLIAEGLVSHNSWLPFTRSKKSLRTDEETLEFIEDPFAAIVLNYRKLAKALNTYIEPVALDPRFYTEYYLETDVGRTNSRNRNIQNIPDGQKPPNINMRTMFVPDSGVYTTGDFSQEHLYILMYKSGDRAMKRVYEEGEYGGDIHQFAAEEMGIPRKIAKTINYAIVYGATPHTISVQAKIKDIRRCASFLDSWFRTFRDAAEWIRAAQTYGIQTGWAEPTLFGRRIKLPDELNWKGEVDIEAKKRKAVNYPILGSDGEVMKRSLIMCKEKNLPLAIQVHDSITLDGDCTFPVEEMEHIAPVRIPFKVSKSARWE